MGDFKTPTYAEIAEIERQARAMQAQAMRDGAKALWARVTHWSVFGGSRHAHG